MKKSGYAVLLSPLIKKYTEMEVKAATAVLYLLGIPGYIYALWVNLGTWKSDILFAAALFGVGFTYYWKWRKNIRTDRQAAHEERMRELERMEREQRITNK